MCILAANPSSLLSRQLYGTFSLSSVRYERRTVERGALYSAGPIFFKTITSAYVYGGCVGRFVFSWSRTYYKKRMRYIIDKSFFTPLVFSLISIPIVFLDYMVLIDACPLSSLGFLR